MQHNFIAHSQAHGNLGINKKEKTQTLPLQIFLHPTTQTINFYFSDSNFDTVLDFLINFQFCGLLVHLDYIFYRFLTNNIYTF